MMWLVILFLIIFLYGDYFLSPPFRSVQPDEVIVISGAGSGIGRATALLLLREGYRVVAGVRRVDDADSLRAAASAHEARLRVVFMDVTKRDEVVAAVEAAAQWGDGRIGAVINNAGTSAARPLEADVDEHFAKIVDVNLVGVMRLTQIALPCVRRARGRIVVVGSGCGTVPLAYYSAYSASKMALHGLCGALRAELAPHGTHVSLLEPGLTRTRLLDKALGEGGYIVRFREQMTPEQLSLYGKFFTQENVDMTIESMHWMMDEPEFTARGILDQLTARRPRDVVVLMNLPTKVALLVMSYLPHWLTDYIQRFLVV